MIVSAQEVLEKLALAPQQVRCLDVRSEGEFQEAAIPGFVNLPILTNEERHQVGLCYKRQGPKAARALGYELVNPSRDRRVTMWSEALRDVPAEFRFVTCWRGGLRSQITVEWLKQAGLETQRIEGGYKALRAELLRQLDDLPQFWVLSGPTGSGKSELLRCFANSLDLECLANHRGSAFGSYLEAGQPAQATFENRLALRLAVLRNKPCLIEDESIMIGHVHQPTAMRERLRTSPVILLQVPIEDRVRNIYREYVEKPLQQNLPVLPHYQHCLTKIERKLGGHQTQITRQKMEHAFASQAEPDHHGWIYDLLVHYYDKLYQHSFDRLTRQILFSGDWNSCQTWISKRFA